MDKVLINEYSRRLKEIAKDLSFLGHPRYPLKALMDLFPQHKHFISTLEDVDVPFPVDVKLKRNRIDDFLRDLSYSDLPVMMKKIFTDRVMDYHLLISMMENFGNRIFYQSCTKLYGSSKKTQNEAFYYFLEKIPDFCVNDESLENLQGHSAMNYLKKKMAETFDPNDYEVKPSSSLLSDSSAGRKTLKLNTNKSYSTQLLDIFLVHEGWVHLGTSINGGAQPDHPWLSTWAPRTTYLQEGLAILTELVTKTMTKERWNKVVLRHIGTCMAENGSCITEIYSYFRHHKMEDLDALKVSLRIFRGVPLEGGMAFTKELLYLHGLAELLYHLHFFQIDLRTLWVGKVSFEEHAMLIQNWKVFDPRIKYFPEQLQSIEALKRLQALKELSFSLFKGGFL